MESKVKNDSAVHLSYANVAVDNVTNHSTISILIEASKTDQTRKGFKPFIGSTGDNLCPVAALVSYMVLKGQASALVPVEWLRGH